MAVAWIVQLVPIAMVPLAVNSPFASIEPHLVAAQMTGALALNCVIPPRGVFGATGVIVIGETTLAVAVAIWPLCGGRSDRACLGVERRGH